MGGLTGDKKIPNILDTCMKTIISSLRREGRNTLEEEEEEEEGEEKEEEEKEEEETERKCNRRSRRKVRNEISNVSRLKEK